MLPKLHHPLPRVLDHLMYNMHLYTSLYLHYDCPCSEYVAFKQPTAVEAPHAAAVPAPLEYGQYPTFSPPNVDYWQVSH